LKILRASAVAILLLSSFAASAAAGKKVTMKAMLVDISCATERANDLDTLRVKHTRKCLQMPECEKSGFGVLTSDNKVLRFDAAGNEQAKALIAATQQEKDLQVKVSGRLEGDVLTVKKLALVP
jgi:hypothetical protein